MSDHKAAFLASIIATANELAEVRKQLASLPADLVDRCEENLCRQAFDGAALNSGHRCACCILRGEEGRLAAEDEAGRLVFADFLSERGEEARAVFIRTGVELESLRKQGIHENRTCQVTGQCAECAREAAAELLQRREREFIIEYGIDTLAGFDGALIGIPDFHRGFVECIACTSEHWLEHGDFIRSQTPLRKVRWLTVPGDGILIRHGAAVLNRSRERLPSLWTFASWPYIEFELPPLSEEYAVALSSARG